MTRRFSEAELTWVINSLKTVYTARRHNEIILGERLKLGRDLGHIVYDRNSARDLWEPPEEMVTDQRAAEDRQRTKRQLIYVLKDSPFVWDKVYGTALTEGELDQLAETILTAVNQ